MAIGLAERPLIHSTDAAAVACGESTLGRGATFWFTLPSADYDSEMNIAVPARKTPALRRAGLTS